MNSDRAIIEPTLTGRQPAITARPDHRRQFAVRLGQLGLAGLAAASRLLPIAAVAAASTDVAAAEAEPFKGPVRIVVPFGAGGIADLSARAVARGLESALATPVVIENKPGAGGVVAGTQVAGARPDGRTLLLVSNGTAVSQVLFTRLPFDALTDFAPVGSLGGFPIAIVVRAESPFRSLDDLVAAARQRPGGLNIGTIAIGSTQHLSAELFKTAAAVDATVVPFNGTPNLITAIRAGDVDAGFEILGPLMPQVEGKALRLLAVSSARRSPAAPDVPTVAEAGTAGYEVVSWNGLAAPKGTPPAIIDRLAGALATALRTTDVGQALGRLGVEPLIESPTGLDRRLRDEITRWAGVIERAGIARQ